MGRKASLTQEASRKTVNGCAFQGNVCHAAASLLDPIAPVSRSTMTVRDRQDLNSRFLFPVDDPVRKLPEHKFSRSV